MAQNILIKGLSFSFDNTDTQDRYIQVYYKDANNKYILHKTTDNKLEFLKTVNGVTNTLTSSVLTFSKFKVFNIFVSIDSDIGTTLSYLTNNGTVTTVTNTDKTFISGDISIYLHNNDGTKQPNAFIENVYFFKDKSFSSEDVEVMLKSRNTITGKETDTHLNELATMFQQNELLNQTLSTTQTINVFPNNLYQLKTTQSTVITEMYNNIVLKTTTVTADTNFITQSRTNKVKFDISGSFSGLSFKLYM